jgi:uncharacterized protein (TIGR02996 family)
MTSMSPDNPFLRALIAQPDDDTLRLALADWLDENEDPARAEFIRAQIELARGVEERERRNLLEKRQRELLIEHEREWVRPLAEVLGIAPGEWGGWLFRRGFVEYFHLPAPAVNRHGEKLSRLTPVRELFLMPCTSASAVTLCKKPWLWSVTALYISRSLLNANAVRALIACPYFECLRRLDVIGGRDVSEELAKEYYKRFQRHLVRSPHA